MVIGEVPEDGTGIEARVVVGVGAGVVGVGAVPGVKAGV